MKLFLLTLVAFAGVTIQSEQNNAVDLSDLSNIQVERVETKPQTIINRVVKEPKIVTEKVIGKTRYITDTFVEPTRQQIIVQPYVNTVTEKLNPVFIKGENKFQ